MDKFHFLVSYLTALANFAKDFHYYCKSFGKHLFADEVYDGLYDFTDTIRESVMLASNTLPFSSRKYLSAATMLVPPITNDEQANLEMLEALLNVGRDLVNNFEGTSRGQNALLDEIAGHLDKMAGLTFLQLRKYEVEVEVSVKESKGYTKEECKACVERAVDRAKAELAKIDYEKVADQIVAYSGQQQMLEGEEESTLDKLIKKLGV